MTREIKFRAWDKKDQKMHHDIQNFTEGQFWRAFEGTTFGEQLFDTDLEIMQYTGLKDKNGKEVYEGDIVNFNFAREDVRGTIKFIECFFIVQSNKSENRAIISRHSIKEYELKIIGNIYENPELLTEK